MGIFPLILGFVLARRSGFKGPVELYVFGTVAVILIMWMSYYLGEWNDLGGDRLNHRYNAFSGGSRVLVQGALPLWVPLVLGYGCLAAAVLTGLYLYQKFRLGPWTLLLGGTGIFCGFFYSTKPFRWSHRGVGEVLVGFCYGWLPVATGFYLLTGFFSPSVLLLSLPISLSIFNVILINEFPDEEADRVIGKRTLVVRFGKERMADLYLGLSILLAFVFVRILLVVGGGPSWVLIASAIPLSLLLASLWRMWRLDYHVPQALEVLCRDTLLVNLSVSLILILQQVSLLATSGGVN